MRLLLQKTKQINSVADRIRITKPDTDPTFEMHRILYSQQVYQ